MSPNGHQVRYSWRILALPLATICLFVSALFVCSHPVTTRYFGRYIQGDANTSDLLKVSIDLNKKTLLNLLFVGPPIQDSQLPSVYLQVPKNTLEHMHETHRELYGKAGVESDQAHPYFKALLHVDTGRVQEVKIKLRGYSIWHHSPAKPSLRVKFKKSKVRNGWRYSELSRPKEGLAVSNWLPAQLGYKVGLISDQGDHVRLFINNKFYGVYRRTRRMGEPLALANQRMPGTFFKGDFVTDMWTSSQNWNVYGENTPHDREIFDDFIKTLASPVDEHSLTKLKQLVDPQAYARWAAIQVISGSEHTDSFHNHAYFVNSNVGAIEAIPWDVGFAYYHAPTKPVDYVNGNPLLDNLTRDPTWRHQRNLALYSILTQEFSEENVETWVKHKLNTLLPELKTDRLLHSVRYIPTQKEPLISPYPWSVTELEMRAGELLKWIKARREFLLNFLSDAQVYVESIPERPGFSYVYSGGSVGVYALSDEKKTKPVLLLPGLSKRTHTWNKSKDAWFESYDMKYVIPVPLRHQVQGEPNSLRFTNAITHKDVIPGKKAFDKTIETRTIHPSKFPQEPTGEIVLGPGDVIVEKDILVGKHQSLTIEPGTTLHMRKGVGIYSRGRVKVNGTKDARVRIIPADGEPWGAFGVSGATSDHSTFTFVEIRGGSTGKHLGILFKGMLSVYNCPNVRLQNCFFGENYHGDDAVNLAQSNVFVDQCEWENAKSDALDLDMCTGILQDSVWRNSGNDAVDLMTCQISLFNCQFIGSGDKGVSVGEETHALVSDSVIFNCKIGVECKDSSRALFLRTRFDANDVAVHSYQKKWMYRNGGSTALVECIVSNSKQFDASIEKRSDLTLVRTAIGRVEQGQSRIHTVNKLESIWNQLWSDAESKLAPTD